MFAANAPHVRMAAHSFWIVNPEFDFSCPLPFFNYWKGMPLVPAFLFHSTPRYR